MHVPRGSSPSRTCRRRAAPPSSTARSARASATDELTLQGPPVRHLRSIDVSEDETCLLLFQTASATARDATLTFEHVAEAVER
jgi:hypothetical protein